MASTLRFAVVALALAAGLIGAVSGLAVWGLRCFDACPSDFAGEVRADATIGGLAVFALFSFAGAIVVGRRPRLAAALLLGAAGIAAAIAVVTLPEWRALIVALVPAAAGALALRLQATPPRRQTA
jgi:hypothetical protein